MAAPLIGRQRELAALQPVVAEVAGGSPAAVLLVGPPGVGKTALARATLDAAGSAGFTCLAGRAHTLSHDAAYGPLAAAFGPFLHGAEERHRAFLVEDLPQLGLVISGLGLPPPAPLGDPALESGRLLDGFARLAERLARRRPLALLIDDVHAADPATLAFVVHLTAAARDHAILLLLTARPDEPRRGELAALNTALRGSSWRFDQHPVAPLGDDDAATLVRTVLGGSPAPALVERIVARCAGRPLFLDALARTVAENRRSDGDGADGAELPLPEGVRAQLLARLTSLAPRERAVLDLLAVAGGDLDFDLLERASDLDADDVVAALDALHHRGLLQSERGTAGYEVVHGLLRDVLLAELSPIAGQRAHARLALALEARSPDDRRLPEHALGAGPMLAPGVALDQLLRGGRYARAVGAGDAEVRYLRAALDRVVAAGRADALADLRAELADALRRNGRRAEAEEAWTAALHHYEEQARPVEVARMAQELGMLAWDGADLATAREHLARAERALADVPPSAAHADLLYRQTIVAARTGDAAAVTTTARALRELAAQLDSPVHEAQAYLAEAVLDFAGTDYVAMAEKSRRAIAAAERGGAPLLVIRAHDQLSVAAGSQLDLPATRAHSEASRRVAREIGALVMEGWPRGRLAATDLLAGDWDAALRGSAEVGELARRYDEQRGAVSSSALHAWVLTHLGRLPEAQRYLDRARAHANAALERDRNIFSIVDLSAATLALAQGDPRAVVDGIPGLGNVAAGWLPLVGLAVLGEAHALIGEVDRVCDVAARLRAVRSCSTDGPRGLASWVAGLAAAHAGATEQAVTELLGAAAVFESLGVPFFTARARLAAASADAAAHPAAAIDLARAALETFDVLGAPIQARQARELLRGLGVVPSRGRARRDTGSPLSSRELEVARLVASGLSNADVATALFISPRTVTTHLDRIYSRLGLSSRVALTRYLSDSGLLDEG